MTRPDPIPSTHLRSGPSEPQPVGPRRPDPIATPAARSGGMGACLWFTGLSGSGKSTTAYRFAERAEADGRIVSVLDGDVVRTHLSRGLGFTREDRDTNVRRIGFVAAEIVKHGGLVVCAVVSPYRATREQVRGMFPAGAFLEIFVDTPLEVCEARDVKGFYARARDGEVQGFTGISDPYEPPLDPELTLDTVTHTLEQNVERVHQLLVERGILQPAEVPISTS